MSNIRRQSIISSVIVYVGFSLGLLNTYLFTREGGFTKAEYGLTGTFVAFANIMFSIASLGMPAYIGKFFPYYNSHLPYKKNDQLTWALTITCVGFLVVTIAGVAFKNVLIDRIFNNSPELLQYYYWTFPFGFGYTIYMVLEGYAWQRRKAVLSNFLKEIVFRFLTTVLIVFTTLHLIRNFSDFIVAYACLYIAIACWLIFHFISRKQFHFTFSISKVTRRLSRKVVLLCSFVWGGGLVFNIANVFDTIAIAAVLPNGMAAVAPFTLAQNISSLMQAPQRAVVSAAAGPLSQAWKDKNMAKIQRIYHRSSINQLIFATAMFSMIWLNFEDGIYTFHLQKDYIDAKWVFFYIGLYKIIDMGTGLNTQIIASSNYWRFEFYSGMILLAIALPLNWKLTQIFQIQGPAITNLIAFTIYNSIRFVFLYRKFGMQPFDIKTVWTLLLAGGCFFITLNLFDAYQGFGWMVLRTSFYLVLFIAGMITLKLTPDLQPVVATIRKRLRM